MTIERIFIFYNFQLNRICNLRSTEAKEAKRNWAYALRNFHKPNKGEF